MTMNRVTATQLHIEDIETPIGEFRIVSSSLGLCDADWLDRWEEKEQRLKKRFAKPIYKDHSDPHRVGTKLRKYFAGDAGALTGIALDAFGTEFQHSVWNSMQSIKPGKTLSYGKLAEKIRRPKASRAVGRASASNPIALVVPCHRVVGSTGAVTGYAGGVWRKQWLLEHESR